MDGIDGGRDIVDTCWSKSAFDRASSIYQSLLSGEQLVDSENVIKHDTDNFVCECKIVQRRSTINEALQSIEILRSALRLYSPGSLYVAFNGGKDATVSLVLFLAVISDFYRSSTIYSSAEYNGCNMNGEICSNTGRILTLWEKPKAIYFRHGGSDFPEVEEFLTAMTKLFDVDFKIIEDDYAKGIPKFIDGLPASHRKIAFVLGSRQGDPKGSELFPFNPSSSYMPSFLRVNCLLRWTYGDIWDFLRWQSIPYCALYIRGFTSLGHPHNTLPNANLKLPEGEGYLPAFALHESEWKTERNGRYEDEEERSKHRNQENNTLEGNPGEESNGALSVSSGNFRECKQGDCSTRAAWRRHVARSKTAAIIVIGCEIVKGQTGDCNSLKAITALRGIGVDLKRVSIIPDAEDDIVDEIVRVVNKFDVIFTSGGIGPTHDDITVAAVAKALGHKVIRSETMAEIFNKTFNYDMETKMNYITEMSDLRMPPNSQGKAAWPILQCRNVFLLPGVPELFERKLNIICSHFIGARNIRHTKRVLLAVDELTISCRLTQVVESAPKELSIGSYPFCRTSKSTVKTIVMFDSMRASAVDTAALNFVALLSPSELIAVDNFPTLYLETADTQKSE